jgi:hypothetical protein
MKTLTTTEKRAITKDWQAALHTYEVYKPMHLLRRNGPILMGVYLKKAYGGEHYAPEFHIHSLWDKSPAIFLNCSMALLNSKGAKDSISYLRHKSNFDDILCKFRQQCSFAFLDKLTFSALSEILSKGISTQYAWSVNALTDSVLSLAYCKKLEEVDKKINLCKSILQTWPLEVASHIDGVDGWEAHVRAMLKANIHQIIEEELVKFKLTKLKDNGFEY